MTFQEDVLAMKLDVMVDLETMSSRNNAAVASFGAIAFNPNEILTLDRIDPEQTFSVCLDLRQQITRHFDGDTIYWWMKQSAEARAAIDRKPILPVDALNDFSLWYNKVNGGRAWSLGATFDHVIIQDLYNWAGKKNPIHYTNQLCLRTLANITNVPRPTLPTLVAHGALDDAVKQAIWLQTILADMKKNHNSLTI